MIPNTLILISGILISYLLGSIPFGYILVKVLKGQDIRTMGSGNTGSTNALRTSGAFIGFLTLLGDFSKGLICCLIAKYVFGTETMIMLSGAAAVIGHCFSIFLGFKSGKGVATSAGILSVIDYRILIIIFIIFFLTVSISKYVALASILASLAAPIVSFVLDLHIDYKIGILFVSILVIVRHHSNIKRLINHEESKITKKEG